MGRIKIRHLVAKHQKGHTLYYWQPPKKLREAGFLPRRLASDTNDLADAICEAERLNAEVDAWRGGTAIHEPAPETIPWLVKLYQRSPDYQDKAPKTQITYDNCLKVIEGWSAKAGHPPITTISRRAVFAFRDTMAETPFMANLVISVLRLLLSFAVDRGLLDTNPARNPKRLKTPARHVVWTPEAERTFLDHADDTMGLAYLLGAFTAQRQGDILAMTWPQYDGANLTLRQAKTGRPVVIPVHETLKAALDGAPRKHVAILTTATGRPFKGDHFRRSWRKVTLAVGLGGFRFQDLRRTAMVRMAEAGATAIEIAAISGHDIDATQRILEAYIPRTAAMGKAAITKLEQRNKAGAKLEG